ncbi:MAG: hypothetical protein A3J59_00890 [Candidatus Buchananbacteria bacterium RIFCSPHIGHO2_02_FULL_56_16]|uniref:Pilus assembly protein PilO n=1 Tax=Candidatus Buchananbacteria bacterium RIFCSPHIGHO2_02_FULL_56_16 TaxID=1797542 RepID=A0A1G1YE25_9BACT|nr:MAG: hypothetical protein A3J59_00890 [Candidatus Buchananbacteria bacterium RIFCSPHIGHO2_02_FULL_56_16]
MANATNAIISQRKRTFRDRVSRYLPFLTAAAVIVILVAGYLTLVPRYREARVGGRNNLVTTQAKKEALAQQLVDLKQLLANYQQLNQADVLRLEKILPAKKDVAGLFAQLQALADEQQFSVTSINIDHEPEKPAAEPDADHIKKLTLTITLAGQPYPAFKALLDSIEYNLRLLDVNAVYFSPETNNYSLNVFTYYVDD